MKESGHCWGRCQGLKPLLLQLRRGIGACLPCLVVLPSPAPPSQAVCLMQPHPLSQAERGASTPGMSPGAPLVPALSAHSPRAVPAPSWTQRGHTTGAEALQEQLRSFPRRRTEGYRCLWCRLRQHRVPGPRCSSRSPVVTARAVSSLFVLLRFQGLRWELNLHPA